MNKASSGKNLKSFMDIETKCDSSGLRIYNISFRKPALGDFLQFY